MKSAHLAAMTLSLVFGTSAFAAPAPQAPNYKIIDHIKLGDGGYDYATFDPATSRAYAARTDFTEVVDVKTGSVTRLASGLGGHMALPIPGTTHLLLPRGGGNNGGNARLIDATTDKVIADLPAKMGPDGATYDPFTKFVYVMNHGSGEATVVDPATNKVVATVAVGGTLEFPVSDGAGHVYVNVEDKGEIGVIDVKMQKTVDHYKMADCEGPTGLAYDAAAKLLISSCDGLVKVIRAADGKEVASIKTGDGADAVIYDAARKLAFIPCGESSVLEVISLADPAHISVVQHIPTQVGTRTGTLDPATGRVYLLTAKTDPNPAAGIGRRGGRARLAGTFEFLVVGP